MVIKHEPHYTDVDSWADVADDDYCYECSKWIEATDDDCCPICETALNYDDEYTSSMTTKTSISEAPKINTYTGDLWNRGKSYVWGGGNSWWNSGRHTGSTASMWGSWTNDNRSDSNDAKRLLKHKRHLDSLCKVVDPTVAHSLDYNYDGKNYSDLRRGLIRIDGSLLKDSDDNLDITAGLAIHEKLHLIHSKPLLKWERTMYSSDKCKDMSEQNLLHTIANTIEDEYIEKQLAKDNAGFVTYIAEVKKHFFNQKMEDKLLKDGQNEFMDILNTLLCFVRWPVELSDERKKKHAKHIRYFARALSTGLDSRDNTYKCIESIYLYLKEVAKRMSKAKGEDGIEDDIKEELEKLKDGMSDGDALTDDEWSRVEESVRKSIERKRGRMTDVAKMVDRGELEELSEAVDYALGGDTMDDSVREEIHELEDTDYSEHEMKEVGLIYKNQRKITWRKATQDDYTTSKYISESKMMKKVSTQLKRKIDLYGNTQKHIIRNQKRGKIDKRMLHRIPAGRQDLFKNDIIQDDKPMDICILVDESGSMGSWKMEMARRSAIATKEALQDNPKLNLWVFGHTADGATGWHEDAGSTNMTEYHGPNMVDRPYAMGAMKARYENRDGNAILASAERVNKESEQPMANKLMIIYSDGQPAAHKYGGMEGRAHVKKVVKHLESKGWAIIQVGISGADRYSQEQMFTNHIFVNDIDDLAPQVSKIIRRCIKV